MSYWIKLPNNLVWAFDDGEVPLIKSCDKLLVVMVYLDIHINNINKCCWTLECMIIDCGFKVRAGKGRTIEQFKTALIYLQSLGWLDASLDIDKLKPKDYVCCHYKVLFAKDSADNDTFFFRLFYNNYNKIINNDSQLDRLITIKIYCYIIARMRRNTTEAKERRVVKYYEDTVVECFYDSYSSICRDLCIKDNTLTAHLRLLKKLGLLYYDNIGLVKGEFRSHLANNVYAEEEIYLKQGLICSKQYYIDKGYKIIEKKCSLKSSIKKGFKGQIQKQKNQGKDTKELELQLKELEVPQVGEKTNVIKHIQESKAYIDKIEYDDYGNVILESILSKEELNNYYLDEQRIDPIV